MKIKLLIPLLLACNLATAQDEGEFQSVNLYALPNGHQTLVFGDKINVREAPNTKAKSVAQLKAGDPITITGEDTTSLTLNGWTAGWNKVAFSQNGVKKEGYVWAGLLSPIGLEAGGVQLVYNVVSSKEELVEYDGDFVPEKRNTVELRAIQNGSIVAKVTEKMLFDPSYETEAFVYGNLGMNNCQNVIRLSFYFPACGYTAYEWWCLWDGKQFTPLPVLTNFSDAGVIAATESYIFPEIQDGIPDQILYQYEVEEGMLMDGTYDYRRHIRPLERRGKEYVKPEIPGNQ